MVAEHYFLGVSESRLRIRTRDNSSLVVSTSALTPFYHLSVTTVPVYIIIKTISSLYLYHGKFNPIAPPYTVFESVSKVE
jgi:hypothetical protein